MPNFSSLARLEVPEKFLWWGGVGGVCTITLVSKPTTVLRLCCVVLCCVVVGVVTKKCIVAGNPSAHVECRVSELRLKLYGHVKFIIG